MTRHERDLTIGRDMALDLCKAYVNEMRDEPNEKRRAYLRSEARKAFDRVKWYRSRLVMHGYVLS